MHAVHAVHLLDANWMYIETISWKHAVRLMMRRNCVEVVQASDVEVRKGFFLPLVLRLLKIVRKFYGKEVPWSKKNLMVRDANTCQYCGERRRASELTVDHITPLSHGGRTTWENTTAACGRCNNRKGGRTPREAGMFPRKRPTAPTIGEFVRMKMELMGVRKILADLGLL